LAVKLWQGRRNWENAYRSPIDTQNTLYSWLDYPNIIKDVWIAEGTYVMRSSLSLIPNTSVIGGFMGNEASVSARVNPANHRAVITGDLGDGRRLSRFLGSSSDGMYSFEDLIITHFYTGVKLFP